MNVKLFFLVSFLLLLSFSQLLSQCDPCETGNVDNSNSDLWSTDCYLNNNCAIQGNPCQANDVTFSGFYFADVNGGPIANCNPGEMNDLYLWGKFSANATRYAVRTNLDVNIDGVCYEELNQCSFDELQVGDSDHLLVGPIQVSCEDVNLVSVSNVWIGWSTNNGSTCANNNTCGQYPPSKCNQNAVIEDVFPLSVDASWECSGSVDQVDFTSTVSGATPPYTYEWNFGNGLISNLPSPTMSLTPGIYNITLTVTDSKDVKGSIVFDNENIVCSPALPVNLTDFHAEYKGKDVDLHWDTSSEINNAGFEVQRATDKKDFQSIGFVPSDYSTSENHSYNYLDNQASGGVNYYRLKQIDFDGSFEYSNIISVRLDEYQSYSVYPNPTEDLLYFSQEAKFSVLNRLGVEVLVGAGSYVDVSGLASGLYIIRFEDGSIKQFVKK